MPDGLKLDMAIKYSSDEYMSRLEEVCHINWFGWFRLKLMLKGMKCQICIVLFPFIREFIIACLIINLFVVNNHQCGSQQIHIAIGVI